MMHQIWNRLSSLFSVKNNSDSHKVVIVGGGTSGCMIAYLTSKWMMENKIPGKVLLIDKGPGFLPTCGPNNDMSAWYESWSRFGEIHDSINCDGSVHNTNSSEHSGIGGCGAHDTRISFYPTPQQCHKISSLMNWETNRFYTYLQATFNMIPLSKSTLRDEIFFQTMIEVLGQMKGVQCGLNRVTNDMFNGKIVRNTIGYPSIAMYYDNESLQSWRWTSAYLICNDIKPPNLDIVTDTIVDKIIWQDNGKTDCLVANDLTLYNTKTKSYSNLKLDPTLSDVILAAGAFGCPAILQRSGIGCAKKLQELNIPLVVDNPEVGHGVDHIEIAMAYEWLPSNGELPDGGVMGWPLVMFVDLPESKSSGHLESTYVQAHIGTGHAEPYSHLSSLIITPNCTMPNPAKGYYANITSSQATSSMILTHQDCSEDLQTLVAGIHAIDGMLQHLQEKQLIGKRISPPQHIGINNSSLENSQLYDWVRDNQGTAFHWCCTCRCGVNGGVGNEEFKLLGNAIETNDATNTFRGIPFKARIPSHNVFLGTVINILFLTTYIF